MSCARPRRTTRNPGSKRLSQRPSRPISVTGVILPEFWNAGPQKVKMMEPIGEILKKMQTRINSSGENTDTWSSADTEPGPVGDVNCPVCKGGGFVHPRLPSGKPDYSRAVSCHCIKAAQARAHE